MIQDGGEGVRLIEADALKKNVEEQYECDCCHDDDDDWSAGRASAWWGARAYIDNAPTIDAIPVEWIKKRLDTMLKGTASAESCFAIQVMVIDWFKEQEADNG